MILKNNIKKVSIFIQSNNLMKEKSHVIIGLSGGPDSTFLAIALKELGFRVTAMHCNFHLRGDESMRDERFVEAFCMTKGIALVKKDFDTIGYSKERKISIEMAARDLRYEAFRCLKEELGADAIAVGHHKDDNVETLMLNMVRGTGIKGVCGMQPKNGDIVRPILCLTRNEIMDSLKEVGEGYVMDHTNMEDEYSRNKVRLDVMPVLESINKGAKSNMTVTMENLNEVRKVYEAAMRDAVCRCCQQTSDGGPMRINIAQLKRESSPMSVLYEVLNAKGFNRSQLKDILCSINDCGRMVEANGWRVLIDRDELIVEDLAKDVCASPRCEDNGIEMVQIAIEDLQLVRDTKYAYLDADKVKYELTVRYPKNGDTFAPFGMKGKRKLVSDFLTDLKMNRFDKEKQLLVCDGEEIVWIVGKRSSELYRITEKTSCVLRLSVKH